jgi:hypothetical protein
MLSRRDTTKLLTLAANYYWLKKGFSCFNELGVLPWGRRRVDFVGLRLDGYLVINEIKSSTSDYRADKKWKEYLPFCNQFYFVMPLPVFEALKEELQALHKQHGIGVLCLGAYGWLEAKLGATKHSVPGKNRKAIVIRMAWRNGMSKANNNRKRVFLTEEGKQAYEDEYKAAPKKRWRRKKRKVFSQ